jgi:hypothetical protein
LDSVLGLHLERAIYQMNNLRVQSLVETNLKDRQPLAIPMRISLLERWRMGRMLTMARHYRRGSGKG